MRSLRRRLMIGTAVSSAVVFSVAGFGLHALIRAALYEELDRALLGKAAALTGLVEDDLQAVEMENPGLPEFSRADQPEYYELRTVGGKALFRSSSLGDRDLDGPKAELGGSAFRSMVLPDGRRGRAATVCFRPRCEDVATRPADEPLRYPEPLLLTLAAGVAPTEATLAHLAIILVGVCVGAALLSAGVLAGVVRLALDPLDDLAERIAHLEPADLSARVDLADAPTEVGPVVTRLNELLARVQATLVREKAFTADVAHELRTPLAGLRSTLDVSLSRPREADAYRASCADCLTIVCQMQTLVENLLALARLEAGAVRVEAKRVQLGELMAECWRPFAEQAKDRRLEVSWHVNGPTELETDAEKLRQVLTNVFANAIAYADAGGRVAVGLAGGAGEARIRVSNTGCTLSPADAERVFDRFWRGDEARHDTGLHCGLGLALCRRLTTCLGGTIQAECTAGGEFAVTISLPVGTLAA